MSNIAALFRQQALGRHPGAYVRRRGRYWIEHDIGGGKIERAISLAPIHYGPAADLEIETAWQPASAPWNFRMVEADYRAFALQQFSAGQIVKYVHALTGEQITFQPQQLQWTNDLDQIQAIGSPANVLASAVDDTLSWTGAYGAGRDFRWVAYPAKLVTFLDLASLSSLPTPNATILAGGNPVLRLPFIFSTGGEIEIFVNGQAWDKRSTLDTAGRVEFRQPGTGYILWLFDLPLAHDQNGSILAGQRLRKQGNNLFVEIRVPWIWLQSAVYPVSIDPPLSLQPDGTAGLDNGIYDSAPDTNLGTNANLDIGERAGLARVYRTLIKFNLSELDGTETLTSVTLSLYCNYDYSSNARTFRVYRLKRDWVETQATWNNYSTDNAWQTAGGFGSDDCEQTDIGSRAMAANETVSEFKDWSLSPTSKADLDLGYGWLIKADTESDDEYRFDSSDSSTAANRPKLVIEYTTGGGGVSVEPAAVSAVAAVLAATVVHGSLALAPSELSAITSKLDPSVILGSLAAAPAALSVLAACLDPAVIQASLSLAPAELAAIASKVDPTVVHGSLALAPAAAEAVASRLGPAVVAPVTLNLSVGASADDAHVAADGSNYSHTTDTVNLYAASGDAFRYVGGLRFANVAIPQGSVISTAYLTVNVTSASFDDPRLTIYGHDVDDSAAFSSGSTPAGRLAAKTTAAVTWSEDGIGTGDKTSPELKTILQEIVDRVSWASGNDLSLLLECQVSGSTKYFQITAYDSSSSLCARLYVEYAQAGPVAVAPAAAAAVGAVTGPAVVSGSLALSPAAAEALAFGQAPTVDQGGVVLAPASAAAVVSGFGPVVWQSSTSAAPAAAAAVAGVGNPAVDDSKGPITPLPAVSIAAAPAAWVECSSLVLAADAAAAVTGSADPSLTIAYRVVQPVAVTGIAAAVSPEVVGGYWVALTLGTHSVSLVLGHRPGVREADLLQLEDESGSWLFESGEYMGFETSLTLVPRSLELTPGTR